MDSFLRSASLADLDDIMGLETAGFPPGIVEHRGVFARRVEAFPEGFLLAGEPAWGYLCAEVWRGWNPADPGRFDLGHDIGAFLDRDGETLYVASMTVAPGFRGSGRGRDLFRSGVALLQGRFPRVRQTVLIVNEHWQGAYHIYRGEGFREIGCLEGFFRPFGGPTGDALVMKRDLTPGVPGPATEAV